MDTDKALKYFVSLKICGARIMRLILQLTVRRDFTWLHGAE